MPDLGFILLSTGWKVVAGLQDPASVKRETFFKVVVFYQLFNDLYSHARFESSRPLNVTILSELRTVQYGKQSHHRGLHLGEKWWCISLLLAEKPCSGLPWFSWMCYFGTRRCCKLTANKYWFLHLIRRSSGALSLPCPWLSTRGARPVPSVSAPPSLASRRLSGKEKLVGKNSRQSWAAPPRNSTGGHLQGKRRRRHRHRRLLLPFSSPSLSLSRCCAPPWHPLRHSTGGARAAGRTSTMDLGYNKNQETPTMEWGNTISW